MDRYTVPSGTAAADPGGGSNAAAAASAAAPAAPAVEPAAAAAAAAAPAAAAPAGSAAAGSAVDDDVEEVARPEAETLAQQKDRLRREKEWRLKNEPRKDKPANASAYHWAYFECYVKGSLQTLAICKLCWEQQELDRAEIKCGQSPTNLLRHLDTEYPGHRAAHDACKANRSGVVKAPSNAAIGGSKTPQIGTYFSKDTTGWHQELVRWMVMNAIPFSVRRACVVRLAPWLVCVFLQYSIHVVLLLLIT